MFGKLVELRRAATNRDPISGLTHCFYRYPARFSPVFARAAIEAFSKPGDTVLDPYMGGGTTILESMASGRRGIGVDVNELAVFVTRAKTTMLAEEERYALAVWANTCIVNISYCDSPPDLSRVLCDRRMFNLTLPRARPIKKFLALALHGLHVLPSISAQDFARCALLNTAQWALNGRKRSTSLSEFRTRLHETIHKMLDGELEFAKAAAQSPTPTLMTGNAADLKTMIPNLNADLVVTSPPYPGIHMLYHRWQVDGRRETPAPYWITSCDDGHPPSFYNFADRRGPAVNNYFTESLRTLKGVRCGMKRGAFFVQMIAFAHPKSQLPRYLKNMNEAGFSEARLDDMGRHRRIWRNVPSRRWHANFKGKLTSSREVVLIHQAT